MSLRPFLFFPLALLAALDAAPIEDFRFKIETLAEGMPQPMELEIAPDGRIFFNEIGGKLKVYHPSKRETIEAGEIKVTTMQESGFLGFALDPKFSENGWIYCHYSPPDYEGGRLSRFTMKGDRLDLASEKVILEYPEQRRECCHHAGTVEFGPDGCLYFSTGDNTFPHGDSSGYAPIDERPEMFPRDAQKSSSNTNDLRGKIVRIRMKPDGTYEIPEGNLFAPGTEKARPEIYVMGCRNPWRFSIDPKTGWLYFGDVGPDAADDGPRGSRGFDEINQVRQAGNFGWPYFVGANFPYADFDFAARKIGALFDPLKPFNDSPNSSGLRDLPPAQPAWIYWPGGHYEKFPMLGAGGRTACAGPVFNFDPAFEKTDGFPKEFDRCLLFWDWQRPFIKWARMDENGGLTGIEDFTRAVAVLYDKAGPSEAGEAFLMRRPVDAVFGRDGCLYMLDYGLTWGANPDSKLVKISYVRGNLAPVAKARALNPAGREPHTVELSSEGTRDPEGGTLKFEWRLGERVLSTEPNPSISLSDIGSHRIDLIATDTEGAQGRASVVVTVGNTEPVVRFIQPQDGDFFTPGQKIPYKVVASDFEDGESSAKPDEFGFRTLVSTAWRGFDGKEAGADPGFTSMKQSDCFNCHAVEQPMIGPSLAAIAERYRGQPGAVELGVKRVIEGSTGVWGQLAMLPHPQHSVDEVTIMVRWILGIDPKKGAPGLARGLEGELTAPKDGEIASGAIEASYTDLGRAPAGTLSGKATVRLRPRRIEADLNDGLSGPTRLHSGGCTNHYCLGAIDHGHHVRFARIPLDAVGAIRVRASSGNVGGHIEIRKAAPDGPLLGKVEVPNTGGWDKWIEPQVAIDRNAAAARADVFLVFVNPGKGGLMNLDWVEFLPR
jgi:cytochrome c